ncbi:MAG: hypothetical protein ACHQ5A_12230 [Opitutales bacterium]
MAKARLPDELRMRLDAIHKRHRTNDTDTIIALLEAFVLQVEQEDAVRFPITITSTTRQELMVAEDAGPYAEAKRSSRAPDKTGRAH